MVMPATANTIRPDLRSLVTYSVTPGAWQADADVRASDGSLAIDRTFTSAILGQTVSISIIVPANYLTSGLDYPVVYHLHGLGTYPGGTNNRYGAAWYPAVYGTAVRAALVRPHITVFPNGCNYSMWIDDDRGGLLIEQYLIKEVLPWVHANYRTLGDNRKYNIITGFSMGGFGALFHAFKRPEVFGGACSYGAPLYASDADFPNQSDVDGWGPYILSPGEEYHSGQRARWLACSPQGYLANKTKPTIRINYGATDGLTSGLNNTFMSLLTSNSIAYTAGTPIPGVGHNASGCWTSSDGQLALSWMETVFASAT